MPNPRMVVVVPSPDLKPTEYVPGIPAAGIAVPIDDPRLKAGLVVPRKPEKPAADKKEID